MIVVLTDAEDNKGSGKDHCDIGCVGMRVLEGVERVSERFEDELSG